MFASPRRSRYYSRVAGALIAGAVVALQGCSGSTAPTPDATITAQPTDQSVLEGDSATFTVVASGATGYQWQVSLDGGTTFSDLAGSTADSHTTPATVLADNGSRFRVVVSGAGNSATSGSALLTVNAAAEAPAFTTHPSNTSVLAPAAAMFTVTVTGAPTPTLQWQLSIDGGTTWNDIPGATATGHTTPATGVADNGNQYRVVASNASGTATSNAATLTVALAAAPSFTVHPVNTSVSAGATAQFSVTVAGVPTPTLQWELSTDGGANWNNVVGATASSYTTPPTALSDNGNQYRVVASNASGTATSNAAILTVTAAARVIFSVGSFIFVINDDGSNGVTLASDSVNSLDGGYQGLTPNGRVVFQVLAGSNADVYSVKVDGTGRVPLAVSLEGESAPGITPNSRVIIRSTDTSVSPSDSDLRSINADGTDPQILANSATLDEFFSATPPPPYTNLTWGVTASGKVVYERAPVGGGQRDIVIVNEDGTGEIVLAATADSERFPVNLPGGWVAYTSGPFPSGPSVTKLIKEDGTGGAALPVTRGGVVAFESGRMVTRGFPNAAQSAIFSFNPDGSGEATLATGNATNEVEVRAVRGGRVIFTQRLLQDLYSVPVGGGVPPVTLATSAEQGNFQGITSNDKVVYGGGDLTSVSLDGTNKTPLAASTDFEIYRASTADGKVIYERQSSSGPVNTDLYIVNDDGTGTLPLATSADIEEFAGLSPSGRVIYFRNVVGGVQLWSVKPDGTDAMMLGSGSSVRFHTAF